MPITSDRTTERIAFRFEIPRPTRDGSTITSEVPNMERNGQAVLFRSPINNGYDSPAKDEMQIGPKRRLTDDRRLWTSFVKPSPKKEQICKANIA